MGFANGDGGDGEERFGKKVPEGERGRERECKRGFFALQFQCHTAPFLLGGSEDLLQIGGHRSCHLRRQKLPEGRSFQGRNEICVQRKQLLLILLLPNPNFEMKSVSESYVFVLLGNICFVFSLHLCF